MDAEGLEEFEVQRYRSKRVASQLEEAGMRVERVFERQNIGPDRRKLLIGIIRRLFFRLTLSDC